MAREKLVIIGKINELLGGRNVVLTRSWENSGFIPEVYPNLIFESASIGYPLGLLAPDITEILIHFSGFDPKPRGYYFDEPTKCRYEHRTLVFESEVPSGKNIRTITLTDDFADDNELEKWISFSVLLGRT